MYYCPLLAHPQEAIYQPRPEGTQEVQHHTSDGLVAGRPHIFDPYTPTLNVGRVGCDFLSVPWEQTDDVFESSSDPSAVGGSPITEDVFESWLNQSALESPPSGESQLWSKALNFNFDFDFDFHPDGLNSESATPPSLPAEDPQITNRSLLQPPVSGDHLNRLQQQKTEQPLRGSPSQDGGRTSHRNYTTRSPPATAKTPRARENNRLAAAKVRARKKKQHEQIDKLYHDADRLRSLLKRNVAELREELLHLRTLALQHQGCCCSRISVYNKRQAGLLVARQVA